MCVCVCVCVRVVCLRVRVPVSFFDFAHAVCGLCILVGPVILMDVRFCITVVAAI